MQCQILYYWWMMKISIALLETDRSLPMNEWIFNEFNIKIQGDEFVITLQGK